MQLRLGFLASHGGSGMKAIVAAIRDGRLAGEPCIVISNNSNAGALAFAQAEGIPALHLSEYSCGDPDRLDQALRAALLTHQVNLVVLSGYLKKIGPGSP